MARKPASKPVSGSSAAAAGQAAAKRQAAARARAEKQRKDVQARFDAAKAEFEAAKAAFQYPGDSFGNAEDAQRDDAASEPGETENGSGDDGVEYLGPADPRERFFAQGRTANGTNIDTATFDSLADPVAQQAAAMMTEDYRAFMQGSEQLILAASGQALKELLVDQKKGAEILAVLAVYQAAITAVGAEVALVAAFTKNEFSSS